MADSKHIPEPWRSFLRELDELTVEETRLDCMGGFVVTQLYGSIYADDRGSGCDVDGND